MGPELIVLIVMMVGITLYALLGGADFGAGVWEFNTALRAPEKERELIYRAIGPVWEANHVWLIFILVGMMNAFPTALAGLSRALWVPLFLALAGIVFRGVGFAFRSYAAGHVRQQAAWGAVFAFASTAAPFFLGAAVGAVASGRLQVSADGTFRGNHLTSWINPLSAYGAFFGVGVCAYLAAAYLTREADLLGDEALLATWRRRAIGTGLWMGVLAAVGLVMMTLTAPELWSGFKARAWPLLGLSVITGLGSLYALWKNHLVSAVIGAASTVSTVIWGLGVAQYPALIPPHLTLQTAKAPNNVLWTIVLAIAAGALVLLPSLLFLFYLFKGKRPRTSQTAR